jgi:hypothetical protein
MIKNKGLVGLQWFNQQYVCYFKNTGVKKQSLDVIDLAGHNEHDPKKNIIFAIAF